MKFKIFFCQFPNPWALRVSGMGGYTSKCEKKSKSLHPSMELCVRGREGSSIFSQWTNFCPPDQDNNTIHFDQRTSQLVEFFWVSAGFSTELSPLTSYQCIDSGLQQWCCHGMCACLCCGNESVLQCGSASESVVSVCVCKVSSVMQTVGHVRHVFTSGSPLWKTWWSYIFRHYIRPGNAGDSNSCPPDQE